MALCSSLSFHFWSTCNDQIVLLLPFLTCVGFGGGDLRLNSFFHVLASRWRTKFLILLTYSQYTLGSLTSDMLRVKMGYLFSLPVGGANEQIPYFVVRNWSVSHFWPYKTSEYGSDASYTERWLKHVLVYYRGRYWAVVFCCVKISKYSPVVT